MKAAPESPRLTGAERIQLRREERANRRDRKNREANYFVRVARSMGLALPDLQKPGMLDKVIAQSHRLWKANMASKEQHFTLRGTIVAKRAESVLAGGKRDDAVTK